MPRPDADPVLTRRQADNVRRTIVHKAGRYVQILGEHLEGKRDLKPTQVKAAQVLLSKVLPDEQRIENVMDNKPELTLAELRHALRDYLVANPELVAQVMTSGTKALRSQADVRRLELIEEGWVEE